MSIANLLALSIMHRNAMIVNSYHFVTQIYHYGMELVCSYFLQYSSPSIGTSVSSLCGRSMGMYKTVISQLLWLTLIHAVYIFMELSNLDQLFSTSHLYQAYHIFQTEPCDNI